MSTPGEESNPTPAPVRAPRWYNQAIITLGVIGLVAYFVTQRQFNWWIILAIAAGIALVYFLWRVQQSFNATAPSSGREVTYGSSTLFGAIWIGIGILQFTPLSGQLLLGGFMIAFGVITLAAFGPGFLHERAQRSARTDGDVR